MKTVKSALSPQRGGYLNSFTHSLQPYSGCAFGDKIDSGEGCPYCYVRRLPVSLFAQEPWGSWVEAKLNVAEVLKSELARHDAHGTLDKLRIFMSSVTDPYQGAEHQYQLTRECLRVFTAYPPALLIVQTRSPSVLRDLDVLRQLGDRVWVSMTLETDSDAVRRQFTPTSPTVESRFRAMAKLLDAGIRVQAAISPMLPNCADQFSERLTEVCSRVLVDTLFHGDGAHGSRSQSLGMERLFAEKGYSEWYSPDAHQLLLSTLREAFGADRVYFSQAGFNTF